MLFTVTARDRQGATRTFAREAESRSELAAALRAERWLVLELKEERAAQAARVYTVTDACWRSFSPSAGDETVLISDGFGDAEVPAAELLPAS